MRAEDALAFVVAVNRRAAEAGTTLALMLTREGIAYDEIDRFMCIGPFLAGHLEEWCSTDADGVPWDDPDRGEQILQGRLWLDGFLAGRLAGRAEADRALDEALDRAIEEVGRRLFGKPPRDDPADRPDR